MAENKTKPTDKSVTDYLNSIDNNKRREDSIVVLKLMKKITGMKPKMWGPSIVGFGSYHYKYATGREGDMAMIGFSPRKQNLTIYFMDGFDKYESLLKKLGKFKTSVSCLYINKLEEIDLSVLTKMLMKSFEQMSKS